MVSMLHVFTIGFQHPGVGTCLRENFAQHAQVMAQRSSQAQPLGQASRIDIHDHVDQGFDFRGLAGSSNVAHRGTQIFQQWLDTLIGTPIASTHQIQSSLTCLGDA